MATQVLSATQYVADGAGLDITALLATPTGTTLQFSNTGREILHVAPGAGAETVTVDVGVTILGQPVTNFSAVTMTNGHVYAFGPFHQLLNQPGGNNVLVVLSTITSIQVALLQSIGVF